MCFRSWREGLYIVYRLPPHRIAYLLNITPASKSSEAAISAAVGALLLLGVAAAAAGVAVFVAAGAFAGAVAFFGGI